MVCGKVEIKYEEFVSTFERFIRWCQRKKHQNNRHYPGVLCRQQLIDEFANDSVGLYNRIKFVRRDKFTVCLILTGDGQVINIGVSARMTNIPIERALVALQSNGESIAQFDIGEMVNNLIPKSDADVPVRAAHFALYRALRYWDQTAP